MGTVQQHHPRLLLTANDAPDQKVRGITACSTPEESTVMTLTKLPLAPFSTLIKVTRSVLMNMSTDEHAAWKRERSSLYMPQQIESQDEFVAFRVALELRKKGFKAEADNTVIHSDASKSTLRRYIRRETGL
jgi:hypothetical protein